MNARYSMTILLTCMVGITYAGQEISAPSSSLFTKVISIIEGSSLSNEEKANITAKLQTNFTEDIGLLKGVAAISSAIETLDLVAPTIGLQEAQPLLQSLKQSAYTNAIHKLIMALWPGKFAERPLYSNSYIESAGFTANDWVINAIIPTKLLGKIPYLNNMSDSLKSTLKRVCAGALAHIAWICEKKAYSAIIK